MGAARLCGARGKALSGKALSALQRLYYPSIYARALMVLSAAFLFATIAPLITLVTIAWLYAVSRAWSFNVRRVYLHDLGADFERFRSKATAEPGKTGQSQYVLRRPAIDAVGVCELK